MSHIMSQKTATGRVSVYCEFVFSCKNLNLSEIFCLNFDTIRPHLCFNMIASTLLVLVCTLSILLIVWVR